MAAGGKTLVGADNPETGSNGTGDTSPAASMMFGMKTKSRNVPARMIAAAIAAERSFDMVFSLAIQ